MPIFVLITAMLEALEYYQSLAQKFQSQLLTAPGIAIVLAGLCVWLAGLRWKRLLGALAGAVIAAAGVGVGAFGDYPATVLLGACVIGLIVGAFACRFVLGLFGAIVGGLLVIAVLTGGLQSADDGNMVEFFDANSYNPDEVKADDFVSSSSYPLWPEYEKSGAVIPAPAAMDITVKIAAHIVGIAKKTFFSAGVAAYGGAALAAVVIVVFSLVAPRLFVAVISAGIGSAVIFVGMIILLFYKGSGPITLIAAKPQLYSIVFGAMTAFGTIVQLLLSPVEPEIIKPSVSKKKDNGE